MSRLATITLEDGTERRLGNNPQPQGRLKPWRTYGDAPETPMIPRSQWAPIDLARFISPIKDQDGIGACNAFDTCYVAEACRAVQGLPLVTLSPGYLYGNTNGGVDEGSTLEDAMSWMMTHGTCLASTVGPLDWQDADSVSGAAEAKKYRVLEAFVCPTFDHMASAIQSGFFVSAGVSWYANYSQVDGDGWLTAQPRRYAGGHAICRCALVERAGVWGLGGPNSWGTSYGVSGFMIMPETGFEGQIGGWWAVREMVDEGGVAPQA